MSVKIIAEIGINHNGCLETAKRLIDIASFSGCDFVKFQKRNPDLCVPENEKFKMRSTPWGEMTYIDYKYRLEFNELEYDEINDYCKSKNIGWFSSVWDTDSVDFMSKYKTNLDGTPTCIMKIPSALITNHELVKYAKEKSDYLMISTGMSNESEIHSSIQISNPNVIFHTNSTYPSPINELNLIYIKWLKDKYPNSKVGYSGHEFGLTTTFASVAIGAEWVERHITLDKNMWGSDQLSSVEPVGLIKLVKGIRDVESSLGEYKEREIFNSEISKRKTLRGL